MSYKSAVVFFDSKNTACLWNVYWMERMCFQKYFSHIFYMILIGYSFFSQNESSAWNLTRFTKKNLLKIKIVQLLGVMLSLFNLMFWLSSESERYPALASRCTVKSMLQPKNKKFSNFFASTFPTIVHCTVVEFIRGQFFELILLW